MSFQGSGQIVVYLAVLIALAYPLGLWMARIFGTFRPRGATGAVERGFYRLVRTDPGREQTCSRAG